MAGGTEELRIKRHTRSPSVASRLLVAQGRGAGGDGGGFRVIAQGEIGSHSLPPPLSPLSSLQHRSWVHQVTLPTAHSEALARQHAGGTAPVPHCALYSLFSMSSGVEPASWGKRAPGGVRTRRCCIPTRSPCAAGVYIYTTPSAQRAGSTLVYLPTMHHLVVLPGQAAERRDWSSVTAEALSFVPMCRNTKACWGHVGKESEMKGRWQSKARER